MFSSLNSVNSMKTFRKNSNVVIIISRDMLGHRITIVRLFYTVSNFFRNFNGIRYCKNCTKVNLRAYSANTFSEWCHLLYLKNCATVYWLALRFFKFILNFLNQQCNKFSKSYSNNFSTDLSSQIFYCCPRNFLIQEERIGNVVSTTNWITPVLSEP